MGKRELVALLILSSWCLAMVGRLFLAMPRGCLQFVIVVFPDHTHLLFSTIATEGVRSLCVGQTIQTDFNNSYRRSQELMCGTNYLN